MRASRFIAVALAALAVTASVAEAGSARLDAQSIKKLFPGYFEAKVQGYRVLFTGLRNGSLKGEAYGRKDQGRWYLKGSALCVTWNQWMKGETLCGTISKEGEWFVASGSDGQLLKFRPALIAQQ